MNRRALTWLLASLLALSAGAAVPSNARTATSESAIVWIAPVRSEQRLVKAPRCIVRERAIVQLGYEPSTQCREFSPFLYQRPPPFLR